MCMEEDTRVREEIAVRMLKETLIPSAQIARWTGLSRERVHALALQTKRLEGRAAGRSDRRAGGWKPPARFSLTKNLRRIKSV